MKKATWVLAALNCLCWGYFVIQGIGDLDRHVPGETQQDRFSQVAYYLGTPSLIALLLVIGIFFTRKRPHLTIGLLICGLLLLPVYLFYYAGGM